MDDSGEEQFGNGGAYFEDLCFLARQVAEKEITAVSFQRGIGIPCVQDLAHVGSLFETTGLRIPDEVMQAEDFTTFAMVTRYPPLVAPENAQEQERSVEIAEAVIHWAEELI